MSTALVTDLTIFVLALLVGIEVIGKVPATLHTPLMSAANSIHGIVLAGALLIGLTAHNVVGYVLAFIAAFFAAANVVGGYVVTGRMLKMFRRKAAGARGTGRRRAAARKPPAAARPRPTGTPRFPRSPRRTPGRRGTAMNTFTTNIQLVYVLAAACFVVGLHLMNSPATARRGNQVSTAGMAIAIIVTLVLLIHDGSVTGVGWTVLIVGALLGSVAGLYSARTVQMTAMPQLVSMFNAVGGGAAALVAVYEYIHDESAPGGVLGTTSVFTVLDVIIGSVTFTGSLIAAGKLQGVITGQPVIFKRRPGAQRGARGDRARHGRVHVHHGVAARAAHPGARLAGVRRHDGAADRRRGHAGRDLAAQRVHRHRGRHGRLRRRQLGADRGRARWSARPAASSPS